MVNRTLSGLMVFFLLFGGKGFGQEDGESLDYQYALIEAVKQKNLGNLPEAAKLYRLVIHEKPECAVAHYELGTLYLISKQNELARESLQKAYELSPENQWYTLAYLNALGAGEEYETLEKILKEKTVMEPEEVEWEYQLAMVYFNHEKSKKALRLLDKIEKERGFSEKITLLKASVFESEKKYDMAREEIEKVLEIFPDALQFRIVAAELCMKNGQDDMAAEYYLKILELDSTNIFALTNLTDYYRKKEDYRNSFLYLTRSFRNNQIDVKRKMAIMSYYLSEKKFIQEYRPQLDKLLEVFLEEHPDVPEGRLIASDYYIETRSYKRAYEQLKEYLGMKQGTYPLYMQAILLANAASLDEELLAITERALEAYPDSTDIRFFRAIGLYEERDYEQIIANFSGISFDDFSEKDYASQSKMMFAEAYYRTDDYITSDSIFESLIRDEPKNFLVLNNYSYYLAERGEKLDKALGWSRSAIESNPENATFLDTYAWILYKLKKFDEAERVILDALRKGGNNDPEINEHAGDIQTALKSFAIAKSYYMRAIILGGNTSILEEKIHSLEEDAGE